MNGETRMTNTWCYPSLSRYLRPFRHCVVKGRFQEFLRALQDYEFRNTLQKILAITCGQFFWIYDEHTSEKRRAYQKPVWEWLGFGFSATSDRTFRLELGSSRKSSTLIMLEHIWTRYRRQPINGLWWVTARLDQRDQSLQYPSSSSETNSMPTVRIGRCKI